MEPPIYRFFQRNGCGASEFSNQHNWKINKKHLVWSKHLLVNLLLNFELLETLLWNAFKGLMKNSGIFRDLMPLIFRCGTHSMVFPLKPAGSWDLEADRTRFILPVAYNFYRHGPFFWAMIKLHGAHHGAHHGLWWSHHQWFHNKTLATWLRNNNERSTNGASWKSPTAQSRRRAQSCRILVFTEFNTYTCIYIYIVIYIYVHICNTYWC